MSDNEQDSSKFNSVEEAIQAIKAGRLVIVIDDADRENEGDFICAAESITPEQVDFMLSKGKGVLCVPMIEETAVRLHLQSAVQEQNNTAPHRTPFLTPVDHIDAGSGVSLRNRALTIRELANPHADASNFVRPGHINTLLAKEGGVLRRAGHTEATIDLMRLAGRRSVGVLIEICEPDGENMASIDQLVKISQEYDIPIITIENLIRYRRIREQLLHRDADVVLPTREYGEPRLLGYRVDHEDQEPIAIVWGDLSSVEAPLVRMHSSCFTGDLVDSLRCDCGDQLHMAMGMIYKEGVGAVVYLPQEGRGIGLLAKLKAYELQDQGMDTVEANLKLGFKADLRDYMVGLQILKDLGLSKIRLLTNNPKKTSASVYDGVDIHVVEQVPIVAPPEKHREHYMNTKRDKMGHALP
ncbi:GTP cyclohydrolase II [Polystyrenella longa]|nr:GTP cyclohydrolase II [Polystyrenella longa]